MTRQPDLHEGTAIEIDISGMAHGGEAVGRHEGRVVFVRGGIPGERVRATITAIPRHGRFMRAVATEVLDRSADRVTPPCRYAGRCGGCDWQHISVAAQRRLKADVIRDQLSRLGGEPSDRWADLVVEGMGGANPDDGLHWRTRMRYAVDDADRPGLRGYHSHEVIPIEECLIAVPDIGSSEVLAGVWPGADELLAVKPLGANVLIPDARPGMARVSEVAAGREWTFDATAFWQVHVGAAQALVDVVLALLAPRPGEHLLDLYSGVGLFAGAIAPVLGPGGRVDAVESDEVAVRGARRSLHAESTVHLHLDRVDLWLRTSGLRRCDLVVLDPPRAGAGREVMERIMRLRPRAIAYVACDPAALARDVGIAKHAGWQLQRLRALDLFPMTHHVECVALLARADSLGA